MSYHSRPRYRPRYQSLSGFFSDLVSGINPLQGSVDSACNAIATPEKINASQQVDDVNNNWNPNGLFFAGQLRTIADLVVDVQNKAFAALAQAQGQLQLDQHRRLLDDAQAAFQDVSNTNTVILNTLNSVRSRGDNAVIAGPGVKRWVVDSLKAARDMRFAVAVVGCARPATMDAVAAIGRASQALVNFVKQVGGAVGDAVAKIPDLLGTLFTVGKWAVLIGGAYFVGVKTGVIKQDPLKLRGG